MKVALLGLVVTLLISAQTSNAQDIIMSNAISVTANRLLSIAHSPQEKLEVRDIETGLELPEDNFRRFSDHTVFVLGEEGSYLLKAGTKIALVLALSDSKSPEPTTVAVTPPVLEVWAYMGNNCPPCDEWKNNELTKLQSRSDVAVYLIPQSEHNKPRTPTFILRSGSKVVSKEGYDTNLNTASTMLSFAQLK